MSNGGWSNQTPRRIVVVVGTPYSGIFFYDPAIGPGELLLSIAADAGTDPYNNSYPQGFAFGFAGSSQVVIGTTGGEPLLYFLTGAAGITNDSAIQTIRQNGMGASGYDQIQVLSAKNTAQNDLVISAWLASSTDGTQDPQIQDYYQDPSAVLHLYRTLSFRGCVIEAGAITAVEPGTGTSRANPAVAETWHLAALGSGWADLGRVPLQYRVTPDGMLEIVGNPVTTTTTPALVIFTLPAGWRPSISMRIGVNAFDTVAGNPETGYSVNVSSTGSVQINSPGPSASGIEMNFSHRIPL